MATTTLPHCKCSFYQKFGERICPSQCILSPVPGQLLSSARILISQTRNGYSAFASKPSKEMTSTTASIGNGRNSALWRSKRKGARISENNAPLKNDVKSSAKTSFTKIREILNGSLVSDANQCEADVEEFKSGNFNGDITENKGRGRGRGSKKKSSHSPSKNLRVKLDMCSKRGDVMEAIKLYDLALTEGIQLEQYHYTVLLYLCSSAALGVVQSAKSGNRARTLGISETSSENKGMESFSLSDSGDEKSENVEISSDETLSDQISVDEEIKKYALRRGFDIYEKMSLNNVKMNEATLTSVARLAMSMGDGDLAFDMVVKQMNLLSLTPKLRSYGPALSVFCSSGNVDKAFAVEKHMLSNGISPEEPELEALLRLSVEASAAEKVYYILHKFRERSSKVSLAVAEIIANWFGSNAAARAGNKKWNKSSVKMAMESRGGGWHGQGWLGSGKWRVSSTLIGEDALCKCCGEKLAIIDLDPIETEKFADSVASIAISSEKDLCFEKFQKWLDYHGNIEAVVDGANVGLFNSRRFMPSKVGAILNAIRGKLPSTRWALVVLHNKRLLGKKMDEPANKTFIEKWKNADALYATPTGSNDDWYWLYAAIKCKSLIVTNDEMRDHVFQLLGNDFFPKWKERHQVRFTFSDSGPVLHMPPPYSVVIQESENGNWHIPVESENVQETHRRWLCITRSTANASSPKIVEEVSASDKNTTDLKEVAKSPRQSYKNILKILTQSLLYE